MAAAAAGSRTKGAISRRILPLRNAGRPFYPGTGAGPRSGLHLDTPPRTSGVVAIQATDKHVLCRVSRVRAIFQSRRGPVGAGSGLLPLGRLRSVGRRGLAESAAAAVPG